VDVDQPGDAKHFPDKTEFKGPSRACPGFKLARACPELGPSRLHSQGLSGLPRGPGRYRPAPTSARSPDAAAGRPSLRAPGDNQPGTGHPGSYNTLAGYI